MSKSVTPVVLNDDGSRHEPLGEGEVLDVGAIPVSTNRRNLLETDDTGILLTGDMLVSLLEHNPIIINVDGRLYFRTGQMLSPDDKVLSVSDNLLQAVLSLDFDQDNSRLVLLGKDNTVISEVTLAVVPKLPPNGGVTAEGLGAGLKLDENGRIAVDFSALGVSSDSDNALKNGSDGKPYLPGDLGKL